MQHLNRNTTTVNVVTTRANTSKRHVLQTPSTSPSPAEHLASLPARATSKYTWTHMEQAKSSINPDNKHTLDKTAAFIDVLLNAQPQTHRACLDSGSSISLIDESYLKIHWPEAVVKDCSHFAIRGLGSGAQVHSYVDLEIALRSGCDFAILEIRFYINPFMHTKIIIGNDVLQGYEAVLNFQTGTVSFSQHPRLKFNFKSKQQSWTPNMYATFG